MDLTDKEKEELLNKSIRKLERNEINLYSTLDMSERLFEKICRPKSIRKLYSVERKNVKLENEEWDEETSIILQIKDNLKNCLENYIEEY